jgi:hypothetical protein
MEKNVCGMPEGAFWALAVVADSLESRHPNVMFKRYGLTNEKRMPMNKAGGGML